MNDSIAARCTLAPSCVSSRALLDLPARLPLAGLLVLLAAALLLVGGCKSPGNRSDAAADSSDPPVNLRVGIPPQATEVAEGQGSLEFSPPARGVIYLYDVSANKLRGHYNVHEGQEIVVSPRTGRATLGANEVDVGDLRPNRTYALYYLQIGSEDDGGGTFRITPADRDD